MKKSGTKNRVIEKDDVVIKFAGDSGDGMQMSGSQFSDTSALFGNVIATQPDYPSEIRAPQGTLSGVSGFQVHIGNVDVHTSGDKADVLVAMNPAALKTNMKWIKPGATIIIDIDNFDNKNYKKAEYSDDPLDDGTFEGYNLLKPPITELTRSACSEIDLPVKTVDKCKNQFAIGLLFWIFNRDIETGEAYIKEKFKRKPLLIKANIKVLHEGYHYAETVEAFNTRYIVNPSKSKKGKFKTLTGNTAVAWGLLAAAEKAKLQLFLGSYPITPATEILQELSKRKHLGVKVFQAEDEIAGVCSAIGASFAGGLAVTTTSGPGLALKGEAIGLAVITELPLVVVNVQRGGPATGLPTKPEQSDLMQALYGRNGESPCIVIAASSPANCFDCAFEAAKLSLEHMTPVILLSDGLLASSSELWAIPEMKNLPAINIPYANEEKEYMPYKRNPDTLARYWAVPGMMNGRHRIGGLEKEDITGVVSHGPMNHQKMTSYREDKVQRVANYIPEQEIQLGKESGDLLVVGWGGSHGALYTAVEELLEAEMDISFTHFSFIKPLPKNTKELLSKFKRIVVCELNLGQFANYLRSNIPEYNYEQYNKVQGLPFMIAELKEKFISLLKK